MELASREAQRLLQRTDLISSRNLRCRWQNHHEQNLSNVGRPIRLVDPAAVPIREILGKTAG